MSKASETFTQSIQDAENLLKHFDALNKLPPPDENEVLKRAGMVMAMTAWETYVEDRVREAAVSKLNLCNDKTIADFVQRKLDEDIRRLHNPNSEKTFQIFRDFAGVNLEPKWTWQHFDPAKVRQKLDEYLKLRGDVAHRSRTVHPGQPTAHPVKREDLERVITFLKNLVRVTDKGLESS